MSASLVGSEMCIRDSSEGGEQLQLVQARVREGAGEGRARVKQATRGAGTVSYTHLTLPTICSV
eukprot:13461408-Alexandrium_andersonii.AAC.1